MNNKPNLKEQALIEEYCTYLCIGTRESYDKKQLNSIEMTFGSIGKSQNSQI